MYSSPHSLFRH